MCERGPGEKVSVRDRRGVQKWAKETQDVVVSDNQVRSLKDFMKENFMKAAVESRTRVDFCR
jgi:hypothetical protein